MGNSIVMSGIRFVVFAGLVVLALGPWVFETVQLKMLTEFYCVLVMAVMWNLLAGYAGIVTVGQHAFVGLGAYTLFGVTMIGGGGALLALGVAAIVGLVLAVPTLAVIFKLRTAYLAVGTWVLAEIFLLVAGKLPGFGFGAGASLGIDVIRSFGASAADRYQAFYVLSFLLAVAAFGGTWAFLRS